MNETESTHTKLPVFTQLFVLFVILGGLFGALLFISTANSQPAQEQWVLEESTIQPLPPVNETASIENVSVQATAAYVWDVREQRALYKKNAEDVLPLASITKLMTSLLTHELFEPKEFAELSQEAIYQSGDSGLLSGEQFFTEDLQKLALISSSNDAAFALGATVGESLGDRSPTGQFVAGMNIRAQELGLHSLDFLNTTGLDLTVSKPGAVGSAKDVSFLVEYIISNYPELVDPTTEKSALVYNTAGAYHEVYNTNELIGDIPNILASKTGYTDLAGGNLTIAFDAGFNRPIIITVLGSTRDGRFSDVAALLEATQIAIAN